jgi:uridine phosphorylase
VASTGIGGPSTAVLIEELSNLGARTFIRIGTCGGIADGLEKGDFVIATGAVRLDGTSRSYAWREYPAVASHEVVLALTDSATRHKARFDVGICLSVDGFYSENKVLKDGKVAPMSQNGYMPSFMVDRLADAKMMNVKNIEMENGTIFTLSNLFGLRAGAICTVSDVVPWHPTEKVIDFEQNMADCIRTGVDGMRTLISWDTQKKGARYWTPSMA